MADFLIVGVTGQDGALLANNLLSKGFSVSGTYRRSGSISLWRLERLGIVDNVSLHEYQIGFPEGLRRALEKEHPRATFFAAGESFTASAFDSASRLMVANAAGAAEQIETMRAVAREVPALFFGSSEVFGYRQSPGQLVDQRTPMTPANPYGVSKQSMSSLVNTYRESLGSPFYEAVLFPHESEFRDSSFVVQKIVQTVAKWLVFPGKFAPAQFGNLTSTRDWGSAKDYMEIIRQLVSGAPPGRYLVGTGVSTSVLDVFRIAVEEAGESLDVEQRGPGGTLVGTNNPHPIAHFGVRNLGNVGHGVVPDCQLLDPIVQDADLTGFRETIREMLAAQIQLLNKNGFSS